MKILIVDDNTDDRRLLRYIVEKKRHISVEAEDGLDGLRMAKIHAPDLIISDALMPVMDGFQFLKAVKEDEKLRDVPFIFYSAVYKGDKDVGLATALGADAYIIKPKEPSVLWEDIETILKAQKKDKTVVAEPITEEEEYLKRYSQVVAAKLEEKVGELETEISERKKAEEKLALANEQLKEEAEVSRSLIEIVETLNTSLDERTLIRNVVNLAPRYLKFDKTAIYLYDEESKIFSFSGGYGFSPAEEGMLVSRTFRRGEFPAEDEILNGKTAIIENAKETELFGRELTDLFLTGSAVIVPLLFRWKLLGAISGGYKIPGSIASRDVTLLKGLADGIAIAIQNSRLYRESVERLMELSSKMETIKTMAQLDREILSNIDKTAILNVATALVNRLIPCERAAVVLREDDSFRVASEWGIGELKGKIFDRMEVHREIFEVHRNSVFIPDVPDEKAPCPYHAALIGAGIKSSLLVPFIVKEDMMGFLDIGSSQYGRLSPTDLDAAEKITAQITVALENARLYEELEQLIISTIASLAYAIDAKSHWTKGHSERVTTYAVEIGREMGMKSHDLERLRLSGLLHDIGKIGTYDELLDKPGKLTDNERELVKVHPRKGAEILAPIKQLNDVLPGILHHHERYAGNGYPDGLAGEKINLQARILCVADSFDSMTSDRPYRPSPGMKYAIAELKRGSGSQFDPKVVDAFTRVLNRLDVLKPARLDH